MEKVSVIIPTYRRFEPLIQTLEDLLHQDYPDFEAIVVDQNPEWPVSTAPDLARLKADKRVRWITLSVPGVVRARNHAVAESTGTILAFIDDDVRIPDGLFLRKHVRRLEDKAMAAVVGRERHVGDPIEPDAASNAGAPATDVPGTTRSPLQQALEFDRNGTEGRRVCTFSTCNSAIRREAFLAVGGFDELFVGHSYGDDYDLALRLHAKGFVIVYDPSPWLVHCRTPLGGLRLTDRTNRVDGSATLQTAWLFVLRHGHRGMYGKLIVHHVLRKTILLKQNLVRPWRQPAAAFHTVAGLARALWWRSSQPRSRFVVQPGK